MLSHFLLIVLVNKMYESSADSIGVMFLSEGSDKKCQLFIHRFRPGWIHDCRHTRSCSAEWFTLMESMELN